MPSRPPRRAVRAAVAPFLAATVAAVVVSTAPAAEAGRDHARDAKRDVVSIDMSQPTPRGEPRPANRGQDIVAVSTVYAQRKVRLTVRVRELRPERYGVGWFVRTADQTWGVGYDSETDELFFEVAESGEGSCAGLRLRTSLREDTVRLTFPRACIGPYGWIRTGVWLWRMPTSSEIVIDDGRLRRRVNLGGAEGGPRLGRRIAYN